jgi:ubiquinone biosynthesis protein COQ9
MSIFILDYKEEVKRLVSENYEPADIVSKEFEMATIQLVENLKVLLPAKAINEHVVYEALIELGFEPKEKEPLLFLWYFKRK